MKLTKLNGIFLQWTGIGRENVGACEEGRE